MKANLGRVVLFGDRSGTWESEAEEGEWAGLHEPWAIVHHVTLHVLLQERNRDAAPHAGRRRTAAELYQKVQVVAQRIVTGRWRAAIARRRADGGASVAQLRKRWEAPGLAVVAPDESTLTVLLFMRRETRTRRRRIRRQSPWLCPSVCVRAPPAPPRARHRVRRALRALCP